MFTRIPARGLWCALFILFACLPARAAPPQTISYQGYLTSNTGVPVTAPAQSLTFRLYDALTAGALLWTEVHPNVAVTNGVFSVALGSVTPFSAATPSPLLFDKPYFLSVQVGGIRR